MAPEDKHSRRLGASSTLAARQRQLLARFRVTMAAAAGEGWLASLLLRRAWKLWQRFQAFYRQLRARPRWWRRRLAVGLAGTALLLALSSAPRARAATISVTPGAAGWVDDGACSLVEAIANANSDSQLFTSSGECTAGSGADVITLAGNSYSYSTTYGIGAALPEITSQITIEANGATIGRSSGDFRIILVSAGGDLTLNQATITSGSSDGLGGGIFNDDGTLTINESTISGNSAASGGGVANYGQSPGGGATAINDSTISGNNANVFGGGVANYGYNGGGGTTTINHSTISQNWAGFHGGGAFNYGYNGAADMTIDNSTISGNSAAQMGGGISNRGRYDASVTLQVNNASVSDNGASLGGGGIHQENNGATSVQGTLARSLVSGNHSVDGANEVRVDNSTLQAADFNVFGDASQDDAAAFDGFTPGLTDITATSDGSQPTPLGGILHESLIDNGGATTTLALVPNSPAVDTVATSDSNCNPGTSSDQRLELRASGAGVGGDACDSGAYELHQCVVGPTAAQMLRLYAAEQRGSPAVSLAAAGGLGALLALSLDRVWRALAAKA